MVLTNSGALFQNIGLLQDEGILAERWQQEGSSIVGQTASAIATGNNFYSVTSGKAFYCNTIVFAGVVNTHITLHDGAGVNAKISIRIGVTDDNYTVSLKTPLKWTDYVRVVHNGTLSCMTMTGWEEDA